MIDLHTHILPGIDDGPADTVGSVAMAEVAERSGIRVLVATPHVRADFPLVRPAEIAPRAAELEAVVRGHGIDIRIAPGAELSVEAAAAMGDRELRALTLGLNDRDLLIETPYRELPADFEAQLDEFLQRGFRVVLAHPERNRSFQREPDRLARLAAAGVLVQVTAGSLTGGRLSRARRLALAGLRQGWVHVIASDSHAADWRPPDLSAALAVARGAGPRGPSIRAFLQDEAPAAILAGEELPTHPSL